MSNLQDDVDEKIIDGLTNYATAISDLEAGQAGALMYQRVKRELAQLVQPSDLCKLAFPSFIIRSDLRAECFAVVLTDRLVIAWKTGLFRKTVSTLTIPVASITSVQLRTGAAPGMRGAALLDISGSPSATITLQKGRTDAAAAVIRTAIEPIAD
ncbi:hypothetical protein [Streptomyces cyanogenus]|uniref:YokE-like PH domain-containing protein n=1 Tax=Streptomyces cyanogenus TaxID=80860 RepID=A0ABX7U262_STRCY|nr:hypothetical protein [Streptomyces cyanogenus]QTE03135.1 hypothetical protein S1361_37715 [Streptomyces cyanogenus]